MEESPKAAKRARTDERDESRVVRCDDLYFSDGTIILRAHSAEKCTYTLFRVHKSILAINSTFFRDLFDGTSADMFDAASAKHEGFPLMDMQDDPKDLEDFLRAIYFPRYA